MTPRQERITEIERRLRKLGLSVARTDEATRILRQGIYFGGFTDEQQLDLPSLPPGPGPAATITLLGCGTLPAPGLQVDFYAGVSLVDSQTTDGSGVAASTVPGITLAAVNATGWTGSVAASNGSSVTLQGARTGNYWCIGNGSPYPYDLTSLTLTDPNGTTSINSGGVGCIDASGTVNNYNIFATPQCQGTVSGSYPIVYFVFPQAMNVASNTTTIAGQIRVCNNGNTWPIAESCAHFVSFSGGVQTQSAASSSIIYGPLVGLFPVFSPNPRIWQGGGFISITVNGP